MKTMHAASASGDGKKFAAKSKQWENKIETQIKQNWNEIHTDVAAARAAASAAAPVFTTVFTVV